jgi:hypothetical protein
VRVAVLEQLIEEGSGGGWRAGGGGLAEIGIPAQIHHC